MKCVKINGKNRQLCIGDLDRLITMFTKSIKSDGDVDYKNVFTDPKEKYAMVSTQDGVTIFDEKNIEMVVSHYFYVLFDRLITAEKWIQFQGNQFRIVKVQDFDERHQFMLLYCQQSTESNPFQLDVGFGQGFGQFGGG